MLKKELREILAKNRATAGENWLDSLTLRQEENTLRVVFPHMYFADWFSQHRRAAFEDALHKHFTSLHEDSVPRIVYESANPGAFAARNQPQPVSPFPAPDCRNNTAEETAEDPFADFICNDKNAFPLATARELAADTSSTAYNPFLVCGRSGTGKSRLLQAMTSVMSRTADPARMVCSSAARFCSEHLVWGRPEMFWLRYDILVLDDIQDLAGHDDWQRKLVTIMDSCPGGHKNSADGPQGEEAPPTGEQAGRAAPRMIFACSGQPQALKALDERLRSRLESGLVVELMEPDLYVRLRYLQVMCKERRLPLTREQLLFLAQRCSQFRLLQGLMLKVGAYCAVKGNNLTQADMENIVRTGVAEKMPGCREILGEVARKLNLRPEDVLGAKRRPDLVLARQVSMYICRRKLGLSYPELGRAFGGRDHSTVIYAINKIKKLMVSNKSVHQLVTEIEMKTP
ncbi:MAG: Chromosomal replication initiator protein DnaA [Desulfovibrio sp.]